MITEINILYLGFTQIKDAGKFLFQYVTKDGKTNLFLSRGYGKKTFMLSDGRPTVDKMLWAGEIGMVSDLVELLIRFGNNADNSRNAQLRRLEAFESYIHTNACSDEGGWFAFYCPDGKVDNAEMMKDGYYVNGCESEEQAIAELVKQTCRVFTMIDDLYKDDDMQFGIEQILEVVKR